MNKKGQYEGAFSNLILLTLFAIVVFASGLLAAMVSFLMGTMQNVILQVDFEIPLAQNNSWGGKNLTHFQDILEITVYPILSLKDSLPYLTYFMIFGFIIALGISAYLSNKTPVFFVIHFLYLIVLTYFAIILSNAYLQLIKNTFINSMLSEFVIYNKLMIYLPQIIFFTGLLFGIISFMSILKPTRQEYLGVLNYGGDY